MPNRSIPDLIAGMEHLLYLKPTPFGPASSSTASLFAGARFAVMNVLGQTFSGGGQTAKIYGA